MHIVLSVLHTRNRVIKSTSPIMCNLFPYTIGRGNEEEEEEDKSAVLQILIHHRLAILTMLGYVFGQKSAPKHGKLRMNLYSLRI